MSYNLVDTDSAMSSLPRLSQKQALILDLLTRAGDSYGLELVKGSGGQLKRGTVYVTLDRMEDKGLVESWTEAAPEGHRGPPRRKYRVTGHGAAALVNWYEGVTSVFSGLRLAGNTV
ncbi:MAG: PadR family transcriptional regulator [Bacteroidota bacterium]